jgi:hypothetical protein
MKMSLVVRRLQKVRFYLVGRTVFPLGLSILSMFFGSWDKQLA